MRRTVYCMAAVLLASVLVSRAEAADKGEWTGKVEVKKEADKSVAQFTADGTTFTLEAAEAAPEDVKKTLAAVTNGEYVVKGTADKEKKVIKVESIKKKEG